MKTHHEIAFARRGTEYVDICSSGNPAVRNLAAMASAARVLSPTESVVLISINCLNTSRAMRCSGV